MELPKQVVVCEVGLRDGLQNEKKILTVAEKLEMIHRLEQAGVKVIEVGSFMHPKAVPQMANTDEVYRNLTQLEGVEYRALVANLKGVERGGCGQKPGHENTIVKKNEIHQRANHCRADIV